MYFFYHVSLLVLFLFIGKYYGQSVLQTFVVLQILLANIFLFKQVSLFNLEVTTTDAYTIGAILGLNLIQELYGLQPAKQTAFLELYRRYFLLR